MVAADVRFDVFHEEYINSDNERENDGLRICGMLSRNIRGERKGKVYCLINGADYALNASGLDPSKWVSRLGAVGAHYYQRWGFWNMDKQKTHPEIRDCVENKMCNSLLSWNNKFAHSYQFDDFAVKFYQEKHI